MDRNVGLVIWVAACFLLLFTPFIIGLLHLGALFDKLLQVHLALGVLFPLLAGICLVMAITGELFAASVRWDFRS